MTPYYEQGGVTIFHADCRDVLSELFTMPVGLVLTDPPYNVGREYLGRDDNLSNLGHQQFIQSWLTFCIDHAASVLCTPGIRPLARYLAYEPKWILAWHKPFGIGHSPVGFNNWEPILMWGRRPLTGSSDYVYSPWVRDSGASGHDCPKPLPLFLTLIGRFSAIGETVVDPFVGSGTSALAAKTLGRRFIGCEIEERYCEIAANRLRQEVLPLTETAAPLPAQLRLG